MSAAIRHQMGGVGRRSSLAGPPRITPGPEVLKRLSPGVVVAVDVGVWHEGIVSDRIDATGRPYVISCSRRAGRALEEPWATFAPAGYRVAVVGYLSRLSPRAVVARARARIGEPWTPIRNCEAFARGCHGFHGSPTVETIAAAAMPLLRVASLVML